MFDFTIYHLRFTVEAITPILFNEFKGSTLRGAWDSYMQKAYCGAPPQARSDPLHQAMCPVCYLTNRETGSETRRPYALQPPLSRQTHVTAGESFQFGFSLFGNAHTLFPYVLLGVREMGETQGLGAFQPELRGRGRFQLVQVEAIDPHTEQTQLLFHRDGDNLVRTPTLAVTAASIAERSQALLAALRKPDAAIHLEFLTPLRIIHHQRLMRWFTFPFFFQRLLERLYGLAEHFSPQAAAYDRAALTDAVGRLRSLADAVQVVADHTAWWDVKGYSQRKGGETYIGGLIGHVTLTCEDWSVLLPYLLWGESVQLGKNVVKGGGLCKVVHGYIEEIL